MAQLGFYRHAYGPVFDRMTELLKGNVRYGKDVHRNGEALGRHCAVAFHYFGTGVALEALASLGANTVLDLGCGGGQFLIDACQRNPKLRGIGLDISADAIDFARKLVDKAGLSDRIKLVVGDAFRPESWPAETLEAEAIITIGTMHENFRDGEGAVVALLDKYAARISTGKLKGVILGEPELVVNEHDADFFLAHVFTLQGMPRPRAEWLKVFPKSQLECRRVFTAPESGPPFAFFELRKRA
jgi:SAM-dependent methyltransferase